MPSASREALPITLRDRPYDAPSSICASTGQTLPGTYLPSWPTKKIRAAARTGTSVPRPWSIARQLSIASHRLPSTDAKAATT